MSNKLRTMQRKMDKESAIPSRRVQIMEELWRGIVQIAEHQHTNPTMLVNRILAEAIGSFQKKMKEQETAQSRLVQPVAGMGNVAREMQKISKRGVK